MDPANFEALKAALRGAIDTSPAVIAVREWMIVERVGEGGVYQVVLGLDPSDRWRRSSPIIEREGHVIRSASGRTYLLDGPPAHETDWSYELFRGWHSMEMPGDMPRRVE